MGVCVWVCACKSVYFGKSVSNAVHSGVKSITSTGNILIVILSLEQACSAMSLYDYLQ